VLPAAAEKIGGFAGPWSDTPTLVKIATGSERLKRAVADNVDKPIIIDVG
jgi:hypothetical protein